MSKIVPAGPARRVVAYIADFMITFAITSIVVAFVDDLVASGVIFTTTLVLYDFLMVAIFQRTFGKMLFGIRLSSAPDQVKRAGWKTAFMRTFVKWAVPLAVMYEVLSLIWTDDTGLPSEQYQLWILNLVGIPWLFVPLLILVSIIGGQTTQGLHDRVAKTYALRSIR